MIRAGEGSGNLDQVTERLTLQYEKDYKLTQQVKSAMTYPVVLLVLCVAIVILIVTFILPQFQSLFDQMDSLSGADGDPDRDLRFPGAEMVCGTFDRIYRFHADPYYHGNPRCAKTDRLPESTYAGLRKAV